MISSCETPGLDDEPPLDVGKKPVGEPDVSEPGRTGGDPDPAAVASVALQQKLGEQARQILAARRAADSPEAKAAAMERSKLRSVDTGPEAHASEQLPDGAYSDEPRVRGSKRKGRKAGSLNDYLPCARELVSEHYSSGTERSLIFWRDEFLQFLNGAWVAIPKSEIKATLYAYLERRNQRPGRKLVSEVHSALEASVFLNSRIEPPCWLDDPERSAADSLICRNGVFDLATNTHHPLSPRLFTRTVLPVAYEPEAPAPTEWLNFLSTLWPADPESIAALQEVSGLLLTPETKFQKLFLVVGPRRSGKGTILRTLAALLGDGNFTGPTLSGLSRQFGLQSLIGKLAAFIGDARLGGHADMSVITERLLSISGEDFISVERKNMPDYVGRLSTRFVMSSNELPKLSDASGALASRFIVFELTQSFYGREDLGLQKRLQPELSSILNWALVGRRRLLERGHFVQPASSRQAIQQLEDLGSPISVFLREWCEVLPGAVTAVAELYGAWREWCQSVGRDSPGTQQSFGRDLRASCSGLKVTQPRGPSGRQYRAYEGIRLKRIDTRDSAICSTPTYIEERGLSRGDQDGNTRASMRVTAEVDGDIPF